ncbi:hypothetical protein QQ045_015140 [Rhodiola kirilowii]
MVPENGASGDAADQLHAESEEEALSLCDLRIDNELEESQVPNHPSLSYRPQQQAEFFEFFGGNKLHSDMCPADDIIVSGKLLPLKDQRLRSFIIPHKDQKPIDGVVVNRWRQDARCRRSESLSELKSTARSDSIKTRAIRTSRSLDDRRRARSQSSFVPEIDRNCSGKSDRSSASSSKVPKSRWQLLISGIGMVKCPPEMELRDIKNRQSRSSNPATLFPATPGLEAKSPASGSSWGLIKALSCKDHTSISVTTSFVCMQPHI